MQFLIPGGAGFIGANLVRRLLVGGHEVTVINRDGRRLQEFRRRHPQVKIVTSDITLEEPPPAAFAGQDVLIHLAHTTHPGSAGADPVYDVRSNMIPALKILEAARRAGIRRTIYPSSGGTVYGHPAQLPIPEDHPTQPITTYGIHKLAIERHFQQAARCHGMESVVLRIANPYGPGQDPHGSQGAIAVFTKHLFQGQPIRIWGDGNVVRDYLYIADLVDALIAAAEAPLKQPQLVLNVGTGRGWSLVDLVRTMADLTGIKPEIEFLPPRPVDVPVNVLDIKRIRYELGFVPRYSLPNGLSAYFQSLGSLGCRPELSGAV